MTALYDTPALTVEDVLDRAKALVPMLKEHAADNDRERRVAADVIEALKSAGVFRVAAPRRHGGLEAGIRSMLDVSSTIAEGDGGAAWVTALSNVNAWTTCLYPDRTVDEIYANGPDVVLSGVLSPNGTAVPVEGGYRVNGTWPYSSASLHADGASVGVFAVDENGDETDQAMVVLKSSDYEVKDTWYVAGMRASGSNTIVVEDLFVPEHRFVSMLPVLTGSNIEAHPESATYRAAVAPVLVMVLIGPQLGLARAALDLAVTKASTKSLAYTNVEHLADSVPFQMMIAEAAAAIDTAHLHAYRAADDIEAYAEQGVYPDVLARARVRSDAAVALKSVNRALDTLLDACGAGSFAEVNPLQRIWRDSNVGARHAVVLPQVSTETYGKALLGRVDHITALI
jgi:3-hydroxy-9,10-secoandrosta-1,3,5(10)-triene-9,17-dione monooxygenase